MVSDIYPLQKFPLVKSTDPAKYLAIDVVPEVQIHLKDLKVAGLPTLLFHRIGLLFAKSFLVLIHTEKNSI